MESKDELLELRKKRFEINWRIEKIGEEIDKYSTFNAKQIGEFLSKTLSNDEVEYVYKEGFFIAPDSRKKEVQYAYFLMPSNISKNDIKDLYYDEKIGELNYNKFVPLVIGETLIALCYTKIPNIMKFYQYNHKKDILEDERSFGKFVSAYYFIDYVIQYRIDNKIENVTDELLEMLKENYFNEKNKVLQLTP